MAETRKNKSIRMNEKERKLLSELADKLGINETQMIIRALRLYKRLLDEGKIKIT